MKIWIGILVIIGGWNLVWSQEGQPERKTSRKVPARELKVEYRGPDIPEGVDWRPAKIGFQRTLSDGVKWELYYQYYGELVVRGTSLKRVIETDGRVHYESLYYKIPEYAPKEPIHTADEIWEMVKPLYEGWTSIPGMRVEPRIGPDDDFRIQWHIEGYVLQLIVSDYSTQLMMVENLAFDSPFPVPKRISDALGKNLNEWKLNPNKYIDNDKETRKAYGENIEESDSKQEPFGEVPSDYSQFKNLQLGRGNGWNGLEVNFPATNYYMGFSFRGKMKSQDVMLSTFDYSRIAPSLTGHCLGGFIATQLILASIPCILDQMSVSDNWLVEAPYPDSLAWGSSNTAAVDSQHFLWKLIDFWKSPQKPGPNTYYPSSWVRSVVGIPNKTGAYVIPKTSSVGINVGDVFHFGTLCGGNWTRQIDVVAHEYMHAIINGSSRIVIGSVAGNPPQANLWPQVIHEGLSDIIGTYTERFLDPQGDPWKIGEKFDPSCWAGRNLDNPYSNGSTQGIPFSDHYCNRYLRNFLDEPENTWFTYRNSGIITLAYSLLAKGTQHPRASDYPGPSVAAIGVDNAAKIFYRAVTTFTLESSPDLFDLREKTLSVLAPDLSSYAQNVRDAWDAVGVYESRPVSLTAGVPQTLANGGVSTGTKFWTEFLPENWYPGSATYEAEGFLVLRIASAGGSVHAKWRADSFPYQLDFDLGTPYGLPAEEVFLALDHPKIGNHYLEIEAANALSGLLVEMDYSNEPPEELMPETPQFDLESLIFPLEFWRVTNPPPKQFSGTNYLLQINFSCDNGNADLYAKKGDIATPQSFDIAATGPGSNHELVIFNPGSNWYFSIFAVEPYEHGTLTSTYLNCELVGEALSWPDSGSCYDDPLTQKTNIGSLVKFLNNRCACSGT